MPVNLLLSYWCVSLHSPPNITALLYSIQLLVFWYTNVTNGRLTQLLSFFVSFCTPHTKTLLLEFHVINVIYPFCLPFSPNCWVKTTCRVSLDSRGCIFHQLPGRFRSRSFSDRSSLNPPLSIEALTIFEFLLVQAQRSFKVHRPV
jgi:hypothetical protein